MIYRSLSLAALALACSLTLGGCAIVPDSLTSTQGSTGATPSPTRTTSTAVTHTVHAGGEKYKVVQTVRVRTWLEDDKAGADQHSTITIENRAGKVVYTREVFDDSGWYQLVAKWLLKDPHYKSLTSLKKAITAAT